MDEVERNTPREPSIENAQASGDDTCKPSLECEETAHAQDDNAGDMTLDSRNFEDRAMDEVERNTPREPSIENAQGSGDDTCKPSLECEETAQDGDAGDMTLDSRSFEDRAMDEVERNTPREPSIENAQGSGDDTCKPSLECEETAHAQDGDAGDMTLDSRSFEDRAMDEVERNTPREPSIENAQASGDDTCKPSLECEETAQDGDAGDMTLDSRSFEDRAMDEVERNTPREPSIENAQGSGDDTCKPSLECEETAHAQDGDAGDMTLDSRSFEGDQKSTDEQISPNNGNRSFLSRLKRFTDRFGLSINKDSFKFRNLLSLNGKNTKKDETPAAPCCKTGTYLSDDDKRASTLPKVSKLGSGNKIGWLQRLTIGKYRAANSLDRLPSSSPVKNANSTRVNVGTSTTTAASTSYISLTSNLPARCEHFDDRLSALELNPRVLDLSDDDKRASTLPKVSKLGSGNKIGWLQRLTMGKYRAANSLDRFPSSSPLKNANSTRVNVGTSTTTAASTSCSSSTSNLPKRCEHFDERFSSSTPNLSARCEHFDERLSVFEPDQRVETCGDEH